MSRVIDRATGQEIDIDLSSQTGAAALAAGQIDLIQDETYALKKPDGGVGFFTPKDDLSLAQRLQSGQPSAYGFAAPEAAEAEKLQRAYGGQDIRTGLEAAASGLTFGATDFAARKLAPELADEMQARREANPTSAMVGEGAALLGAALASGGTSLAARAASAGGKGLIKSVTSRAARVAAASPAGLVSRGAEALGAR